MKVIQKSEIVDLINTLAVNLPDNFVWSDELRKQYKKVIKSLTVEFFNYSLKKRSEQVDPSVVESQEFYPNKQKQGTKMNLENQLYHYAKDCKNNSQNGSL